MTPSNLPLADWRGDLTMFQGFHSTRPAIEYNGEPWSIVVALVAPSDCPAHVPLKEKSVFFVPCLLQSAPLVGLTLQKAKVRGLPTVGKQRSANHVTSACMIVVDLDGITDEQLTAIEQRLTETGLTYLLYSSHSFGRADKPGMRCRLVVPVDTPLDSPRYKPAAQGLNIALLGGLADPSGFALYQQQGVWATAPERVAVAFRRVHKAGVASAEALAAAAPVIDKPQERGTYLLPSNGPLLIDAARINAGLAWLDANDYKTWTDCAIWLKAAYGDSAYPLWLAWSEGADDASKTNNDGAFAPAKVWGGIVPRITVEQGSGALYARARDGAMAITRQACTSQSWDVRARGALVYLRRYHQRLYAQTFGVAA